MNHENSFGLVLCFVFYSFLNCSVFILFKFGGIWKKWPPEIFTKKRVVKSFAKFTGKHLCRRRPETLLRKRIWHRYFPVNFTKFSKNIFFIEHFQVPSLLLLLESPIFWGFFLQTYLMDICGSFRSLCKCFRFIYQAIMIIQIVLTPRKFVIYVCWLNKMPPSFLVWISELM